MQGTWSDLRHESAGCVQEVKVPRSVTAATGSEGTPQYYCRASASASPSYEFRTLAML
jgi:hypothetical protein